MMYKTTNEVAHELHLSKRRIMQAAQTIGIDKHGRDYAFTDHDVNMIRQRIGKRGRPGKKTPPEIKHS